jgi:hypothetical protein
MKTIKLLLICFLLTDLQELIAQSDDSKPTRISSREARRKLVFGFKGGFNFSNVYDESKNNFIADGKTGGVGGAFIAIPFGDFIGFQPEILLAQKGFKGAGIIGTDVYNLERTTTHLDIPLQLQLKPFSWLSMLAGVQYSYLLRQRDEFTQGNEFETIHQEFNNDDIRRNLLGVVMGGDLNFWHVVFSGRAGWDLLANHGDGNSTTPQYKNLWFQMTIGYRVY